MPVLSCASLHLRLCGYCCSVASVAGLLQLSAAGLAALGLEQKDSAALQAQLQREQAARAKLLSDAAIATVPDSLVTEKLLQSLRAVAPTLRVALEFHPDDPALL